MRFYDYIQHIFFFLSTALSNMKYLSLFLSMLICSSSFGSVVILNGLTHIHSAIAGGSTTGKISVQNNGSKDEKIIIYQEDLLLSCDHTTVYEKVNSHARSSADWLRLNISEKVLKPNEIYEIRYTVNIPSQKGIQGSYWSIVMIEGVSPIKEEVESGVKIDSKVRYAVQVINNVGNVINGVLSFENIALDKRANALKVIDVKLKNGGIFLAKAILTVEIYDKTGRKVKVLKSVERKIYPDKCTHFEIEVKSLPKGTYNGIVIADNGKDLFGSNLTLEIE